MSWSILPIMDAEAAEVEEAAASSPKPSLSETSDEGLDARYGVLLGGGFRPLSGHRVGDDADEVAAVEPVGHVTVGWGSYVPHDGGAIETSSDEEDGWMRSNRPGGWAVDAVGQDAVMGKGKVGKAKGAEKGKLGKGKNKGAEKGKGMVGQAKGGRGKGNAKGAENGKLGKGKNQGTEKGELGKGKAKGAEKGALGVPHTGGYCGSMPLTPARSVRPRLAVAEADTWHLDFTH